jgi:2-polyprenyl-6-hydroxyphenyl methylase / 3-demethylubiquinone-9 3-methyltransferase
MQIIASNNYRVMETIYLYNKSYADKLKQQKDIRIRRLLKYFNFNKTQIIADLGCGEGKLAKLISHKIKEYFGVDFSLHSISYAKELNSDLLNAKFIIGDISDFCKNNQMTFDKVFTLDFSEHIDDCDFSNIYSSIYRSLKEKGELIIHTPNRDFIVEWLKEKGILKQFPEHIAVRNEKQYLYLLKNIGFSNTKVIFLSHYLRILRFLHVFSFLPLVGKFFKARLLIICQK